MNCSDINNEENTVLGNKKSYFGGKIITSNKLVARTFTFLLIGIPYGLFSGTVMVWFAHNKGFVVPLIVTSLFITSISLFIYSCFSDPGIIPRQKPIQDTYDLFKGINKENNVPQEIHMMIDGKFLRVKYCTTCNMYRSPRSVHCRICDVCVKRFDHHCKWLGNCIGYNNYRAFIAFIATTFITIFAVVLLSIYRAINIKKDKSITKAIVETVLNLSYILLTSWFVAGLLVYHCYLICTNQTTNEQLKSVFNGFNPWSRGVLNNIKEVLFRKRKIKHFYLPSLKIKSLYNPVSQVTNPKQFDLVKDRLVNIVDVLDYIPLTTQNQLSLHSLNSWDPKSPIENEISIQHNSSTLVANSDVNDQSHMYNNLGKPMSLSSLNSSELSISSLMDTYTKLKNNLSDTFYLNQIAQDKINDNIDDMVNNEISTEHPNKTYNESCSSGIHTEIHSITIHDETNHSNRDNRYNGRNNSKNNKETISNSKIRTKLVRKNGIDLSCRN